MLRRLQAFAVLMSVCAVSIPALAQEPDDDAASDEAPAAKDTKAPDTKAAEKTPTPDEPPPPPPSSVEAKPAEPEGWHTEIHGYFRAPMALGLSSRPGPDNLKGPSSTQISYGPNRTVDASYYSFAYTRLQEQDWAELFIHEKKKHVDAVVGWMGYWYQTVGFRNPDASWVPGMAYLTLDTDFDAGAVKPNVALTMGAWWPKFGYFEKYDTYTLGRFRQMGEQVELSVPFNPDLSAVFTEGFGTGRDGSFNYQAPPQYGGIVGLDLLTWENVRLTYKKNVDASLHFNTERTADPNLTQQTTPGKTFSDAKLAHVTVLGAEANLRAPVAGHLWISPSIINVRNGWALANGGTEVMHGLGGVGLATNYLGWTNTPPSSTGSGSMTNLGFMYENSISNICGEEIGRVPDLAFSVFGLFTKSKLDLPVGSTFPQDSFKQVKYGVDATVQTLDWLSFMLRYDLVNLDMDHGGYIFSGITARAAVSSHFLSSERIYLQYTRYKYGDNMTLAGTWTNWGAPLVAGNDVVQAGPYAGQRADYNVIKMQAEVAF